MRVLVIGSGAREHALVWKLAQSPRVTAIYSAPGNPGMAEFGEIVPLPVSERQHLADWASANRIDLTVVGPEDPLANGIVDLFEARGLAIVGTNRQATQIESSKDWAKRLMVKYGVPTARGATFDSPAEARDYIRSQELPIVVKADGLAAGKGVTIARSYEEALEAVGDAMERRVFGPAGHRVVIEECLTGPEVSVLALTDGKTVATLIPACDYKRALDRDEGGNTGGMGAYAPPGFVDSQLLDHISERILKPTVVGLAAEGVTYRGVLYAGLILTAEGVRVLEFNARFGDPETQVILPLLQSDLLDLLLSTAEGRLDPADVQWIPGACCAVVLASGGYPSSYLTGYPIDGLERLDQGALAFQAGIRRLEGHQLVTAGGRVITVVATGHSLADARDRVYNNVARIHFEGMHYRRDIAAREVV